jgi:DNA-binding phage protein
MINNGMIKVSQDLDSLSYDTGIEIEIIPNNFDCAERFTMITASQLNTIMMADSSLNKENILLVFLYINSYIGCRSKKNDGTEFENAKNSPEAFFKSLESMAKEISMSKETINQSLEYLTSPEYHSALLVRKNVNIVPSTNLHPPKNIPNIYVLNKHNYQQEIKWALDRMTEIYKTKIFEQKKKKIENI